MAYYASFDQIFAASHNSGNSFNLSSSISATDVKLYPVNPQVNPTNIGNFVSTGSAQSVWLEYVDASAITRLIECTLTNGAERINGGAEDIWVFRQNGTANIFILTSSGYVATAGGNQTINSSINLGDLDQLVVQQMVAPTATLSSLDISADTGVDGDFVSSVAAQTITATLSAALGVGEVLLGSLDGGATWTDITGFVSGTALTWSGITLASSGVLQLKLSNPVGDGPVASQAYTLDTVAPATTFSGLDISADTGVDGDFVTSTAAQTITATLSAALGVGETLLGSLDGGATWTDITGFVTGTSLAWTGATLSGTSSLQLKVTDLAGNDGPVKSEAYTLDITAPTTVITALDISADTGVDGDFVTNVAAQTISATLGAALGAGEALLGSLDGGATWTDITGFVTGTALAWTGATLSGTSSLQLKVVDLAGNDGPVTSQAYTLNAAVPTTTLSSLDISADTGVDGDFVTSAAAQTVTATLGAALGAGEALLGSLDGGATWTDISSFVSGTALTWFGITLASSGVLQLKLSSSAGDGPVASQAYTLDTAAPAATFSSLDISADTGVDGDFVTSTAAQTITATLSAALGAGEALFGSLDGGATWTDITGFVPGTALAWTGVTLASSGIIQLKVTDLAGNDGLVASQTYTLDTAAPTTAITALDISADTGVDGDFVTNVTAQTISATLGAALGAGEALLGSLDGGATWTDITGFVSGTALAWTGATLASSGTLQLKVADLAGNDGPVASQAYALDTTAPAVLSVSVPSNGVYQAGQSLDLTVTFDEAVILAGGTPAILLDLGGVARTALYQSGSGTSALVFRYTVAAGDTDTDGIAVGALTLGNATIADAAGNPATLTLTGHLPATGGILVDTTAPAVAITSPALSRDATPVLSGTAEAGSTVTVAVGGATYRVVATNGSWSLDLGTAVPASGALALDANGSNPVSATATDATGNVSPAVAQALVLDTTPPGVPGFDTVATDDVINAGEQAAGVTITGSTEAGSTVALTLGGRTVAATVSGTTWSYTLTPTDYGAMGEGAETITATATDAAGNTGAAGQTAIRVDTAAPGAPTGLAFATGSDTGLAGDGLTSATRPTITGMAEPGAVVVLHDTDGTTVLGTATADGNGLWTITSAALALGDHSLTATATDAAGNRSGLSAAFDLTVVAFDLPPIHVTANTVSGTVKASLYSGPVEHLRYAFEGSNGGEAVVSTAANDFLNLQAGDDAADGGEGEDVLDGGTGSNFLSGGGGADVFFLDGRSGETTWSTITDWSAGEQLSVWGWRPGVSRAAWIEGAGAEGYQGVTMHADLDGNGVVDTSVTWAGRTRADLPVPTEQDGLLWFA